MRIRLLGAAILGLLVLAGCTAQANEQVRTVTITINHSSFGISQMDYRPGETVRFEIHNTDPIDHEFILGDQAVQDRHETGNEPHHGAIPGEVSVPAGQTATTTYTFDEPGTILFGCHLPGHFAYGMRGTVTVR